MTTLPLSSIVVDPTIQIRRSNQESAIAVYADSFELIPPVVVYETEEGLLLSDGFQRVAAATRRGEARIKAEVRKGTRADALEWAAVANARNGAPLTAEERRDGIRRLRQLHPPPEGYTERKIAELMGVSNFLVHQVFAVDEVRRKVLWRPAMRIADAYLYEASQAEEQHWKPLLQAADRRGWTRDDLRTAVKVLKDEEAADDDKRALLAGEVDPSQVGQIAKVVPVAFTEHSTDIAPATQTSPHVASEPVELPKRTAPPPDPVGADTAERLQPVVIEISLRYEMPSGQARQRGIRTYSRESEEVTRRYEVLLTKDFLQKSAVEVVQEAARRWARSMTWEGWPRQERWQEEGMRA